MGTRCQYKKQLIEIYKNNMAIIIHFNTFFGEESEINKLDILDALENEYGSTIYTKQVFENPENEEDGFDLYVQYPEADTVDLGFLKELVDGKDLYILVYDINNNIRHGYWYDEDDEWVENELSSENISEIISVFNVD
jgi:hypothetical protein